MRINISLLKSVLSQTKDYENIMIDKTSYAPDSII